jgi:hypothetical protein
MIQEGDTRQSADAHGAWWALAWVVASGPVVFFLLRSPAGAWGAMLGYHLGCILAARAAGVQWGQRPSNPELVGWAGATVFLLGTTSQLLPGFQVLFADAAPRLQQWGMHGWLGILAFTWYVVANPWIEERFWRGSLLGARFQYCMGRRRSMWIAILGFVPYHVLVITWMFGRHAWWLSVPVLLGSILWTGMTLWRRSVIPAAVSHQMADLVIVLLYVSRSSTA